VVPSDNVRVYGDDENQESMLCNFGIDDDNKSDYDGKGTYVYFSDGHDYQK